MKVYKMIPGAMISLLLLQGCSDDDDATQPDLNAVAFSADSHIRTSTLPQPVFDYITANYPGFWISEAELEDNGNYEVELSNGIELIFNSEGDFLGVDDDANEFGDRDIDPDDLPQNILDFIEANFPGVEIEEAEIENNGHYEIELENDVELIFDGNGNFLGRAIDENDDDQDDEDDHINPSQLPEVILDYIAENYPDSTIVEAEREDDGFEVTLSNGVELEFDLEGNFISAEDGNGDDDDDDDDDGDDD